jgi:hypothetical protein
LNGNIVCLCFEQNNENKRQDFLGRNAHYKLPLFKNVAINVIEKQKHLYMAPEK